MEGQLFLLFCSVEKKQSPQSQSSAHSRESDEEDNEASHHSESMEDDEAASSSDSNEQQQQEEEETETTVQCRVDVDHLYSDQSQDGQTLSRTNVIRDIVKVIIIHSLFALH